LPSLTQRQQDVVDLVVRGRTNRAIADQLGVSPKTVEKHVADVFVRWQVSSRTALVARWQQTKGCRTAG
jgi:DNA-binding NarL/FixJ family response regulator